MATAATWLKEQALAQDKAAKLLLAQMDAIEDSEAWKIIAQFQVAQTVAHVFNGLSIAIETIAADQHLSESGVRRARISEELRNARAAAANGFATGDWTAFDSLIAGEADKSEPAEGSTGPA